MKKILIIEDDPLVANLYRSKLEKEGYQVEIALDGQSGFYRIHEMKPEAILLDLMLPQISGLDILKKIRAQKQFERLPVLVFSNAFMANVVHDAISAGATHVFNKATTSPSQIVEAMRQTLFPSLDGATAAAMAAGTPAGEKATPSAPQSAPMAAFAPAPAPVPAIATTAAAVLPEKPAPASGADLTFQSDLQKDFFAGAPETLMGLRRLLQSFAKADSEAARLEVLNNLYRRIHAITGNSGVAGLLVISQVSALLEALLQELYDKPKNITASTIRTVAHTVDFLGVLFERRITAIASLESRPPKVLVVDDEVISRRAVIFALDKAKLSHVAVDGGAACLTAIQEHVFDLIFLDVDMPGMNGFELCTNIRTQVDYKTTPIVFVTSLGDFESRARSSLSGGNDLIAKPFMFIELAVKALTYIMRNRLPAAR